MFITASIAITSSSFAQSGSSLTFDGIDDYVDCGNNASVQIGGTAITIEAWIKPASFGGGYWTNTIVDKTYNSAGDINYGYVLRCGGSGQLDFGFGYWNGSTGGWPSGTSDVLAVTAGVWQHVAATYDGSNIRLYVNGSLVKTVAESRTISINTVTSLAIGNPTTLSVGSGRAFNGMIDEVRIWNSVRTPTQITDNQNANLVGNEAGLAAYYKMNEGSGATTADQQVLLRNTGTLVNGTIWGVSGAMPVELTSFNAFTSGGGSSVELYWKTATEVNNFGFDIERKSTSNWSKIGFIEGHGTTNAPQSYSYTDNSVNDKVTYRLKQIDRDGMFEYSKAVEVMSASVPAVFALSQNYPNPFNPTTNISFTVPSTGRATLKILNILGQEVATLFDGEAQIGIFNQVQFNASGYASGMYFSRLEQNGKAQMTKMTLLK